MSNDSKRPGAAAHQPLSQHAGSSPGAHRGLLLALRVTGSTAGPHQQSVRCSDIGMAHQFLLQLERSPGLAQKTPEGVAECVPTDAAYAAADGCG